MSIASNLELVLDSIESAAKAAERSASDITLVAVSKKKPLEDLRAYELAARERGVPCVFGENYLQELKTKRFGMGDFACFHMIGPLQSNKVKEAVLYSDVIESAHSGKILNLIADHAQRLTKRQKVMLQVNIGRDPLKSGFDPSDVVDAIRLATSRQESIELIGLMTITPYEAEPEETRVYFKAMRELRDALIADALEKHFTSSRVLLSMGMSSDYHVAIEEGADIVRVGTAIFGAREG
jgi:pyridoxal phosphate enzyme (YggS family)